jgi:pimeloyl-ACP methyl ester carboxylesterase
MFVIRSTRLIPWSRRAPLRAYLILVLTLSVQVMTHAQSAGYVQREDFRVESEPGIAVFVRELRPSRHERDSAPLLLVHGGGPGGLASFDLPVPGYSLAEDLAMSGRGRIVYIMDVRGWAGSTRPKVLDASADVNPPAVRVHEAAQDIAAVVEAIRARTGARRVALFGWASGAHWNAFYTTRHADKVSHLILLNTIYGVNAPWPFGKVFEDRQEPERFDRRVGAYALSDADGLVARWNSSIPIDDKIRWRDPLVVETYVRETLASDPANATRTPPAVRIPTAFRLEAFEMSRGHKYWDATDLRVPTLAIRGGLDFWSRPADLEALERELVNAPQKRVVTIPDATHYLFNDRPAHGRARLIEEIVAFIDGAVY